ncbi:hypothetical protein EVAR_63443_1 [Eumeta japonica]|uniref:Uncharacterized protein n=1 Tax=Eumeta variegata TaxID=151549 RepID=A0A4C1YRL0_EUMVA|nr:hypothetical protein EVAR_63443_1 [Eumeta japonica]
MITYVQIELIETTRGSFKNGLIQNRLRGAGGPLNGLNITQIIGLEAGRAREGFYSPGALFHSLRPPARRVGRRELIAEYRVGFGGYGLILRDGPQIVAE